ncbi:hypothetical protein HDU91_003322 [Kappamyces sp. JEL0680]|nr:hypothetical protein HDU91_003322 [Kappamyces sp. JEL0680]
MLESELLQMSPEIHQSEYNSKITQLGTSRTLTAAGYVLLFSASFPFAPFLAWVNNILEQRSNLYKRLVLYEKPFAEGAKNIGDWETIMNVLVKLGIFTTSVLIAFTGDGSTDWLITVKPESDRYLYLLLKLCVVVVFEHVLYVIAYLVDAFIPDVPSQVLVGRMAEDYIDRIRLDEDGERDQIDVENADQLDLVSRFDTLFFSRASKE